LLGGWAVGGEKEVLTTKNAKDTKGGDRLPKRDALGRVVDVHALRHYAEFRIMPSRLPVAA